SGCSRRGRNFHCICGYSILTPRLRRIGRSARTCFPAKKANRYGFRSATRSRLHGVGKTIICALPCILRRFLSVTEEFSNRRISPTLFSLFLFFAMQFAPA